MPRRARFVCVFNRDRDRYEVPLALEEAGLLEALVTDWYAPDAPPRWLPRSLAGKRRDGLPRRRVVPDRLAFPVQNGAHAIGIDRARIWPWLDARLGRTARVLAERRGAHLYCYHTYVPREVPGDACLIIFVFHPLGPQYLPILEADAATWPEAAGDLAVEREAARSLPLPPDWTRADAIVCASSMTARTVIAAGAPEERIAVIPYGGDPAPVPAAGPWPEPRFLFVGQGVARKGLHHLIRAWQARPRGDARLTIVAADIDPGIRALIRDPSITVLGYQNRGALEALYASHDVFVMPSLVEGFGLVYLEALAAGCHVVGTANTGLPDLDLPPVALTLVGPGAIDQIDTSLTDLALRKQSAGFDRAMIAEVGTQRSWADFRAEIAAHAAATLAAWEAAREEG